MSKAYFDITPPVTSKMGVFPGDVGFKRDISLDFKKGHHLLLSSIETTLHLGAHADAPNHYDPNGVGIGERELDPYLGKCQVVEVGVRRGERVKPQHLSSPIEAPRVLFKTKSFPDPNQWNSDFCSLSQELIELLAQQGVILVGIDTPSIDPEDSKSLESHNVVAKHRLAILEGIVLDDVPEGVYSLVALPLRLMGADASPVRALLFKDSGLFEGA